MDRENYLLNSVIMTQRQRASWYAILLAFIVFLTASVEATQDALRQNLIGTLQAITTLEARFTEKGPQGERAGTVFLVRPPTSSAYGKLKFVYDSGKLEIISIDGTVYVWNKQANTVDDTPLSSTPLFFFLRSEIRLGDAVREKGLTEERNHIHWTLAQQEDENTEGPEVRLIFQRDPGQPQKLRLSSWVITDATGNETQVTLTDLKTGHDLGRVDFSKPEEKDEDDETSL